MINWIMERLGYVPATETKARDYLLELSREEHFNYLSEIHRRISAHEDVIAYVSEILIAMRTKELRDDK